MKYVYLSPKVQNRIERLKKSGRAGNQLAHKVTRIIESLTSGAVQYHRDAIEAYTKYGENRIKNCRKYNLGCGYRLIILKRDSKIYIPFLGPHDACQRWLDHHSRKRAIKVGKGACFEVPAAERSPQTPAVMDTIADPEKGTGELGLELSDQDLRRVFKGLVENPRKYR